MSAHGNGSPTATVSGINQPDIPAARQAVVTGLWIGDALPPLAELCIRSYQDHGFKFQLLTYGAVKNVPEGIVLLDAREVLPECELFTHATGSLAPTADRIRYKFLAERGGLWTDMDVACLRPFQVPPQPWFALQETGVANLAVLSFPAGHEVMMAMERQMADPAAPMPWDGPAELDSKARWRTSVPEVKQRQMHAEWSLGGPEGFTRALKHFEHFHLAAPQHTFNPVHYTGWRWNFDGTLFEGHPLFTETVAIHLWAELLRREPDALEYMSPHSIVAQLMRKHGVRSCPAATKGIPAGTDKPRILVGICSCRKHGERRQVIRDTWLSKPVEGIEALFFVGHEETKNGNSNSEDSEAAVSEDAPKPDTVILDAKDVYEYLPQKVRAFFAHALKVSDFDWLFKCDDDTYVVMDRLHDLIDARYEIIGSKYLAERGSPSGGAGYFLSRRIVEMLANDSSLPLTGDEDVINGEAAIRHGARPLATERLRMDYSIIPKKGNAQVTAHWCSVDRIRAIHSIFGTDPIKELEVSHPVWRDRVQLFPAGYFTRTSTGCYGAWSEHGDGDLLLHWFDWPAEVYSQAPVHSLHGVSSGAGPAVAYQLKGALQDLKRYRSCAKEGRTLLHLGCGPNRLAGWENLDMPGIDIRDPLPWPNNSVDALFLEHVIEHVSPPEAFRFMRDAMRVLKPGGILRLAFPDVLRIARLENDAYRRFLVQNGWGDGSAGSAVASIVLNHGHLGVWSAETMSVVLESLGFTVRHESPGSSTVDYMRNLEHHGTQIGHEFNAIETACIEAVKPAPSPFPTFPQV